MDANLGSPRVGVVSCKRTVVAIPVVVVVAVIVAVEAAVAFAVVVAEPRSSSGSSSSRSSSFPSFKTSDKNPSDATRQQMCFMQRDRQMSVSPLVILANADILY